MTPTAADTKFWTASPAAWTSMPIVDSPEEACQFVFVTKLTAVFQARLGAVEAAAQRQVSLEPLECEEQQDAHGREGEPTARVPRPVLLGAGPRAGDAVDPALDRAVVLASEAGPRRRRGAGLVDQAACGAVCSGTAAGRLQVLATVSAASFSAAASSEVMMSRTWYARSPSARNGWPAGAAARSARP